MVTNSSKLMDFIVSVAVFQLEKQHLAEVVEKRFVDELVLDMGLAGGMEFEPQDG